MVRALEQGSGEDKPKLKSSVQEAHTTEDVSLGKRSCSEPAQDGVCDRSFTPKWLDHSARV